MLRVSSLLFAVGLLACVPEIRVAPRDAPEDLSDVLTVIDMQLGSDRVVPTIDVFSLTDSITFDVSLAPDRAEGGVLDAGIDAVDVGAAIDVVVISDVLPAPDIHVDSGSLDVNCPACSLPNAVTMCRSGGCVIERCNIGFGDCNEVATDGCEVDLSSAVNCGACGRTCDAGVCFRGICFAQRSCAVAERGCGLVAVTGGVFSMGSPDPSLAYSAAIGRVRVSDFVADSTEVTVGRFRRFWSAGHPRPSGPVRYPNGADLGVASPVAPEVARTGGQCNWSDEPATREEHPVNCVTWDTAQAFCVWDGGRIPTEAELEYLGRGREIAGAPSSRDYPWGNEMIPLTWPESPVCGRAQFQYCLGDDGAVTRRVGSFAASGGVFDLVGNVSEMVADDWSLFGSGPCWSVSPTERSNPLCVDDNERQPARGGSYATVVRGGTLVASRNPLSAAFGDRELGFRCVRSP